MVMRSTAGTLNYLAGIHFSLTSASKRSQDYFDFSKFSSANNCFFDALPPEQIDLYCYNIGNSWFLPFSLASAPELWLEIGQWLTRGLDRKIKLRIGNEEFEKSSLIEVMDFLYRTLIIYECRDKN